MQSDQALARLESLLRAAGVNIDQPSADDVRATWRVVQQFAAEPVDDVDPGPHGDLLLAQFGTYDWGTGEHFEVDLTRQFVFADDAGDYDHMAQLNCTFRFEPTEELLRAGDGSLWSGSEPLDEFFRNALVLPGFTAVCERRLDPLRLTIYYGDV